MSGLQKVVSILPEPDDAGALDLIVEAGSYGLSCLWYRHDEKRVEGILVSYGNGLTSGEQLARDIRRIFESEPVLNEGYRSVSVFHNFPETLIFPDRFFSEGNTTSSMKLFYGEPEAVRERQGIINGKEMTTAYRVPEPVDAFFNSYLFNYQPSHSFQALLTSPATKETCICCTLYPGCFRVLVYKEGKLQLAAIHDYFAPEDVAYVLLNICLQHEVKPADMPLVIDGMIEENSNLFLELSKYFQQVGFAETPSGIHLNRSIQEYPSHYFHHLIELATCAS